MAYKEHEVSKHVAVGGLTYLCSLEVLLCIVDISRVLHHKAVDTDDLRDLVASQPLRSAHGKQHKTSTHQSKLGERK